MNASVKENIVFGHRWDPHFYNQTVEACALLDDFETLPDGDSTEVGERGISLSGGQKSRLTLARAVYARADIYLLDDVLSAVDQHVGRHLIDRVLGPKGLLKGKTRILATNAITILREADFVCLLRDQRILEKGTYDQLMAMKGEIANLIKASSTEEVDTITPSGTSKLSDETDDSSIAVEDGANYQDEDAEEVEATIGSLEAIRPGTAISRIRSFHSLRRASTASFNGPRGKSTDEEDAGLKSKQSKEVSEQGKVKWSVYGEYAKTSNLYAVAIYLIALVAAQTAQVGGSFWLKHWSEVNEQMQGNPQVGKYIGVYFAFGIGSAALVVLQTLILWIFCSIEV
jgi:ATP-binding cassette, subfamily C (CFTR/MRP), member 1